MTENEVFEAHKNQVCKELEMLADKFKKTGAMSETELDRIEKLWRTKKNMLAAAAMENPEEYEEYYNEGNMSGRRGRSSVTGRFVSRDGGQSYAEGYSQGYNEAMTQNNSNRSYSDGYDRGYSEAMRMSGHYPMNPMMRNY